MKGEIIIIYLDWAATTPLCEAAKKSIIEHLDDFGNPSSNHELGRQARVLIEDARERIAKCINADPTNIYFTSGGSEADSWAMHYRTVMASALEHHAVVPERYYYNIDTQGFVDLSKLEQSIKTCCTHRMRPLDMFSCMYVNNELGTIQCVKLMSKICHDNGLLFHTDAVQALPHIRIDVKDIDCDMLSASGHKCGAPKGVGFLYTTVSMEQLINGGKQENGLRGGTENVLGIISMAAAIEDTVEHMEERNVYVKCLRDKMLDKLLQIPGSHLNGSLENRVCSNINIRFDGVPGARLVSLCSLYGVYISSGSACNEGEPTPSHVLKAIGLTDEEALSSVRITLGHTNTEQEIDQATNIITKLVERIRNDKQ